MSRFVSPAFGPQGWLFSPHSTAISQRPTVLHLPAPFADEEACPSTTATPWAATYLQPLRPAKLQELETVGKKPGGRWLRRLRGSWSRNRSCRRGLDTSPSLIGSHYCRSRPPPTHPHPFRAGSILNGGWGRAVTSGWGKKVGPKEGPRGRRRKRKGPGSRGCRSFGGGGGSLPGRRWTARAGRWWCATTARG